MSDPTERIERILDLMIQLADGHHEARIELDDRDDSLSAVALGLNMLGEELQAADVAIAERTSELERSNADLERFAAAVAHDLREPARHVGAFAGMLAADYGDRLDERGRGWLNTVERSARRMHDLIDGLLSYAQITERSPETPQATAREALDEALQLLEGALREAGGRVRLSELPDVTGDQLGLTRVWQNLIGNALKYRAEGRPPVIEVSGCGEGDEAAFCVSDNGIGIEPAHAEHIFTVFRRLHSRDQYDGVGLGLSLARRVIERHGGRLWLDTEAEGPGSTFRFTLPTT